MFKDQPESQKESIVAITKNKIIQEKNELTKLIKEWKKKGHI